MKWASLTEIQHLKAGPGSSRQIDRAIIPWQGLQNFSRILLYFWQKPSLSPLHRGHMSHFVVCISARVPALSRKHSSSTHTDSFFTAVAVGWDKWSNTVKHRRGKTQLGVKCAAGVAVWQQTSQHLFHFGYMLCCCKVTQSDQLKSERTMARFMKI